MKSKVQRLFIVAAGCNWLGSDPSLFWVRRPAQLTDCCIKCLMFLRRRLGQEQLWDKKLKGSNSWWKQNVNREFEVLVQAAGLPVHTAAPAWYQRARKRSIPPQRPSSPRLMTLAVHDLTGDMIQSSPLTKPTNFWFHHVHSYW